MIKVFQKYVEKYKNGAKCISITCNGVISIIGDIHGNYDILMHALQASRSSDLVILLGDYIDRGPKSKECLVKVLELAVNEGSKYVVLAGNHEGVNFTSPFMQTLLPEELDIYKEVLKCMPLACMLHHKNIKIYLAHAGLPRYYDLNSIVDDDIAYNLLDHNLLRHCSYSEKCSIETFINMYYERYKEVLEKEKINEKSLNVYYKEYLENSNITLSDIWNQIQVYMQWSDIYIPKTIYDPPINRHIDDSNDNVEEVLKDMNYNNVNIIIRGHKNLFNGFACYDFNKFKELNDDISIKIDDKSLLYITIHTVSHTQKIIKIANNMITQIII